MSSSRKWISIKRLLLQRQNKLICILLLVSMLFFVSKWNPPPRRYLPKRRVENSALAVELPGGDDPGTEMNYGVLGNYEAKEPEEPSSQPGEGGRPVHVEDEAGKAAGRQAVSEFGFNTYVSDMISMNRTIPDIRMTECKYWNYPDSLPTVSVVIVFHNEAWTPLLRTVHSILLRSPPSILYEIVMVDDYSEKEHLKNKLEKYLTRFEGKVRLVRTDDRLGLIGARNVGAKAARADVVVFLDAHCEVNINWLPPLLAPIRHNRKIMTVPVIDGIDAHTWEYRSAYGQSDRHFSGIFEWGLLYKETQISDEERDSRSNPSMPFRSPTHAGGLFAIDKKWFEELGYYDDGLKIWGGEQYELSFKIWMCGGGILFVPCSHVGHVYRNHMPYNFGKYSGKPIISTNMMRVVKTWMGDYEKYYLTREPQATKVDPGDLSTQLQLKEKLKCKNFKWYMDNVAMDVLTSYPELPENMVWGEARNPETGKCLDRLGSIPGNLGSSSCHGYGGNQLLRLNAKGQLAQGEWCLTSQGNVIRADHCPKGTVNGAWSYNNETQQLMTKTRQCATIGNIGHGLQLTRCDVDNGRQKFVWKEIYQ